MIKGIIGSGYVDVHGGMFNTPYISPGAQSAGMVRYSPNSNNLEVYDGVTWLTLNGGFPTVELSATAKSVIEWAMKKMQEEAELKRLGETHPAIKIALENLEKAKKQLDATIILSKDHE